MEKYISIYKLKTISADLTDFDYLAKENDFIEISEWHNGEGYDVTINDKTFSLTHGVLKAINVLTGLLDVDNLTIKNND